MLGTVLLGIASVANAGSGDDKSIELTDQECMAQSNMSSAFQFCDVFIWKIGDSHCAITAQCRAVSRQVIVVLSFSHILRYHSS
ncbi:hypothetical protein OO184_08420 [Photorhabdus sp. APURE]|uniref:hypothetical protein n=1 Tax=Photorhabdus aballayi TaxID=2991723 RepID=UPI00223CCA1F|nr:hypothetical protein [Photorhabdus aballayi]MCW7547960.1 hypothetical protein [Photorhabdus aballayi]